jgi:hypothetical protein
MGKPSSNAKRRGMSGFTTQTLISLVVSLVVVVRFIRRELSARVVRTGTLWIRPALLVAVSALVVFQALRIPGAQPGLLSAALAGGAACGLVTGFLVVRSTTFSSAGRPGAVNVHGSRTTAAIWVGALLLRLLARFVVGRPNLATELVLNAGLCALATAAFLVLAIAFQRAIANPAHR